MGGRIAVPRADCEMGSPDFYLALARSYDRTAKALTAILAKQSEIDALLAEVRRAGPGILVELAAAHPAAAAFLEDGVEDAGPAAS